MGGNGFWTAQRGAGRGPDLVSKRRSLGMAGRIHHAGVAIRDRGCRRNRKLLLGND